MGDRNFECTVRDYCTVASTFRSSDNVDALACINSSLDVCCAVGSWDNNVCIFGEKVTDFKSPLLNHLWVHLKCTFFKCNEEYLVFNHTCSGDNPLHLNSSFLQKVDRQASGRAGARHAHANLSGHHGDWG